MEFFPLSYSSISAKETKYSNPYATMGKIPLGTLKPRSSYGEEIPEEEIVYIKFDPIKMEDIERNAFNILILGASGDGKSLIAKNIWSTLHDAGYYNLYIDPKGIDSGNAKLKWQNDKLAPLMQPKGIPLKHYLPMTATTDFEHMIHNFETYSLKLEDLNERDMWLGLGLTTIGAIKVRNIINNHKGSKNELTIQKIIMLLNFMAENKEINSQVKNAIVERLTDLQDLGIFDNSVQKLDLMKDFRDGKSICISYNSKDRHLMSFDVGEKIRRIVRSYFDKDNPRRNPAMIYFDDSSYYAKFVKKQDFNLAVSEILNIGNNYRALGIFNCMMVQTLGIIDEDVAETYPIKIISPKFKNPESLHRINIPKRFIQMLQDSKKHLVQDKDRYLFEWTLVQDGEHVQFFPFLPPCNHFKRVYFPK
jgi:hypothetical protein